MGDTVYEQSSGVRFRVSGVSKRSQRAVSESLMILTFLHRCWPSVATLSAFRIQNSIFTLMKLHSKFVWVRFATAIKIDRIPLFDVRCWTFDVSRLGVIN